MKLSLGQRNSLMGILNVLTRISDEEFIKICWNNKPEPQLKCNSIIFSCREAVLTLEDYHLFELIEYNNGLFKREYSLFLGENLLNTFIKLARILSFFIKKDKLDACGNELILDVTWIEIMVIAKQIAEQLKEKLSVNEHDYLM